ncbi:Nif3-like dinuclear metal center hexameric protein [Anoxybacillus sp.]|uniref:Nif3-like dinuclear metal center hexameric protein n=1 Tax=Anoxybacillus sp. TaxID=1872573 RepID=UPI00262DF08A|nr:Nif3-like dinuclear metal center hexameric protein [uncultured Anoxybacillus sp.]
MRITVQHVVDQLVKGVEKVPNTVDSLKYGETNMEVKGISVSFMPTYYVIEQTILRRANLLITHEGLFYSHSDHMVMFQNDSVYQEKLRLIRESGIAVYRFHDYLHRQKPDGIMLGLLRVLGWEKYVSNHRLHTTIISIPPTTLSDIAEYVKRQLQIPFVRVTGDLSMHCTRIGVLVGYRGSGELCIPLFEQEKLDLIIYGEGPEWEVPEYVRDSLQQDKHKSLIVLGHSESEEPGMKYLAEQLQSTFPNIPVHFIDERPVFQIV